VLSLDDWKTLFALSDKYGFIIASDECYSEIYFDEANPADRRPAGGENARPRERAAGHVLQPVQALQRAGHALRLRRRRRGNPQEIPALPHLPRLRHGAGGADRSVAAWNDEAHVLDNRDQYREKFAACTPLISQVLGTGMPDASFYLWAKTPIADTEFARGLLEHYNVVVLPGSFLAREAQASTRAPTSCASRWSRRSPNAWKRPNRISTIRPTTVIRENNT
jgi:N-succinyldiaminopimelate aminotransferase